MDSFRVKLSQSEFVKLNRRFPNRKSSSEIGKRAIEIVMTHFKRVRGCSFKPAVQGADLAVVMAKLGQRPKDYEVKGTCEF